LSARPIEDEMQQGGYGRLTRDYQLVDGRLTMIQVIRAEFPDQLLESLAGRLGCLLPPAGLGQCPQQSQNHDPGGQPLIGSGIHGHSSTMSAHRELSTLLDARLVNMFPTFLSVPGK